MEGLIVLIKIPLKLLGMSLLSVFARLFYDESDISWKIVLKRVVMSSLVLLVAFYLANDYFGLSESVSLMISGSLAFAFREVLGSALIVAKNPAKLHDFLTKKKNEK